MPSQRKRIGFLPSEEVHEIIEKFCRANKFSQSKVTGILVNEALRSRGVLKDSSISGINDKSNFIKYSFEQEPFPKNNKSPENGNDYIFNKESFSDDIKMMHEFIEFKYFKKVMKQNNNFFDL